MYDRANRRTKVGAGFAAAWGLMFVVLGLSGLDDVPDLGLDRADLAGHVAATGLLAGLLSDWRKLSSLDSAAALMAAGLGLGIELAQLLSRDRSFEWVDLIADVIGAMAAILVYRFLGQRLSAKMLTGLIRVATVVALAAGGWVLVG